MKKFFKNLSSKLKSKFYFDYDTSKNVWFRSGGKATVFCLVYDEKELEIIINNMRDYCYEIIGAGSNLLIRDRGYNGIILKLGKNFNNIILHNNFIEVGGGILDLNLSKFAQKNNIKDFEFYSGIPGTIGGAIKMNAGCYDFETKDILKEIKTINSNGEIKFLSKDKIKLKYRNSSIPEGDVIISANFNYSYGDNAVINEKMKNIKLMRENSQPLKTKTSGSAFKNPKKNFAAKLIQMSDCKGMSLGDAVVSNKHANFLINTKEATATQIEELGNRIIERVFNKFNIKLEWEIRIIGNK